MAGIVPLAVTTLNSTSTPTSSPTLLYTSTGDVLMSVIITNTTGIDCEAYVYVETTSFPTAPQIAYKLPIPAYNSYETFRFATDLADEVFIAGSAGLVFYAQGIEQIG
jgi:hypothetical protein